MAIIKSHRKVLTVKIKSVLEKALIVTGEQAVGFVRPIVPIKTGNLRSSITFATIGFKSDAESVDGFVAKSSDLVETPTEAGHLFIGTNVEYAAHQEFGTNRKGNNETRKGNRLVRRSFLRLGVLSHRKDLGSTFAKTIKGLLK